MGVLEFENADADSDHHVVYGCVLPAPEEKLDFQDSFLQYDRDEQEQLDLKGLPVSLEHNYDEDNPNGPGSIVIGEVEDSYTNERGEKMVKMRIAKDKFFSELAMKELGKKLHGLSLSHNFEVDQLPDNKVRIRKTASEVSICEKGRRPKTDVTMIFRNTRKAGLDAEQFKREFSGVVAASSGALGNAGFVLRGRVNASAYASTFGAQDIRRGTLQEEDKQTAPPQPPDPRHTVEKTFEWESAVTMDAVGRTAPAAGDGQAGQQQQQQLNQAGSVAAAAAAAATPTSMDASPIAGQQSQQSIGGGMQASGAVDPGALSGQQQPPAASPNQAQAANAQQQHQHQQNTGAGLNAGGQVTEQDYQRRMLELEERVEKELARNKAELARKDELLNTLTEQRRNEFKAIVELIPGLEEQLKANLLQKANADPKLVDNEINILRSAQKAQGIVRPDEVHSLPADQINVDAARMFHETLVGKVAASANEVRQEREFQNALSQEAAGQRYRALERIAERFNNIQASGQTQASPYGASLSGTMNASAHATGLVGGGTGIAASNNTAPNDGGTTNMATPDQRFSNYASDARTSGAVRDAMNIQQQMQSLGGGGGGGGFTGQFNASGKTVESVRQVNAAEQLSVFGGVDPSRSKTYWEMQDKLNEQQAKVVGRAAYSVSAVDTVEYKDPKSNVTINVAQADPYNKNTQFVHLADRRGNIVPMHGIHNGFTEGNRRVWNMYKQGTTDDGRTFDDYYGDPRNVSEALAKREELLKKAGFSQCLYELRKADTVQTM